MFTKVTAYYVILAVIMVSKVSYTLYERTSVINHGQSAATFQMTQKELAAKKISLEAQVSDAHSLKTLSQSEKLAEFVPISKTVAITSTRTLANAQ